jgi:S1-C subfamily serine protease
VLVEQVEHGGPAAHAGVRGSATRVVGQGRRLLAGGGILTLIEGQPMTRMEELQPLVQLASPGQQVAVLLGERLVTCVTSTIHAGSSS